MFTTAVTPRFGDVDGLQHINNTKLPEWFEQARGPIFRMFNPSLDLDNWNLIMARITVDFLDQMFLSYDVEIRTHVVKIGNSSFVLGHEAWQQGRLCVTGEAVIVHYDFERRQSVRIPDPVRAALTEHLAQQETVT